MPPNDRCAQRPYPAHGSNFGSAFALYLPASELIQLGFVKSVAISTNARKLLTTIGPRSAPVDRLREDPQGQTLTT